MRPIFLCTLLAASFASALPVRAQHDQVDDDYDVFQVVLAGAAPVTVRQLPEKCGAFGPGWFQQLYRTERARARVTCRMIETEELRAAGGVRWRFARYTRRWVIPPADSRTPGESRDEEVVVLFSQATDGGRLYPQWMASYGPDFTARVYLLTASTPDGGVLLSVLECVNGTGGCQQHFMLRRARRWRPVREPWQRQLPSSMQGRFWKGTPYVDPATLRGSGGLYADGDGNCCPSRDVNVRLALRGDSLVLLRYSVTPNPRQ